MTLRAPYCQRDSKDPALRAHGCTLFSDLWLRRWASENEEAPKSQVAIDKAVWDLQKDSGATRAQFLARGTTLDEAELAFEHDPFKGRTDPQMRKFHGGNVRSDLIPLLEAGAVALVAVNYGVIVSAGIAVGSFMGGHACVVGNPSAGKVDFVDPLRKQTIRLDIDVLETAMERFGKKPWLLGRGEFGVVNRSLTDLEVAKAQRDKARDQRNEARRDLAKMEVAWAGANRALLACEARPPIPTDPDAIAAARAAGIADAAANAAATT